MTLREIARQRLISQQLTTSSLTKPEPVVRWFAAVQAQEYALSKWAIGLRLPDSVDADVENAIDAGRILRTHLLRPTWHFIAADDIHWLRALSAPRVHAVNAFMYRKSGLDAKLFKRTHQILIKSLEGGKQLTRDELNAQFRKRNILAVGPRLGYIMMHAELEGIITSGARRGNQFTYALLEERAPVTKMKTREEALAELTARYFRSRGPATINDFSTWSGLTVADCKKGVQLLGKQLSSAHVGQNTFYYDPQVASGDRTKALSLLPVYDEYIMGYKDRTAILQTRNLKNPAAALTFDSTIIYDGQIVGTWRRIPGKKMIDLGYAFFGTPSASQERAFANAVRRYAGFTACDIVLHNKSSKNTSGE